MDIKTTWKSTEDKDEQLSSFLENVDLRSLQSRIPLSKLRKNLLIGIYAANIITVFYLVLLFLLPLWVAYLTLFILIVFNVFVTIDTWKLYKKTKTIIEPGLSLKEELTMHYEAFQRWWRLQERISIFVYPIAAAGGFILGGVEGSGKTVSAFLTTPSVLFTLGITIAVLVPVCYFGARWMFHFLYGKYLINLKALMDDMD